MSVPSAEPVIAVLAEDRPRRAGPSGTQVFLGLFILGQIVFLLVGNFCGMLDHYGRRGFPDRMQVPVEQAAPDANRARGHLWKLNDAVNTIAWYWGQVTGQPQNWSLFAPNVGIECNFPALLIRWEPPLDAPPMLARPLQLLGATAPLQATAVAALLQSQRWIPHEVNVLSWHLAPLGATHPVTLAALHRLAVEHRGELPPAPEVLLSENEPRDVNRYLRIGKFRLRRLEGTLLPYLPRQDTWEKTAQHWRNEIESHVRRYGPFIEAYSRFRLTSDARYRDRPLPAQVMLVARRYRIKPPDEQTPPRWTGPQVLPIARWQPHAAGGATTRPVEWYNPETERFEAIAK